MIRILHVTPSFYPAFVYGGPIHSVYSLCRSFADNGNVVRVLTTDANGPDSVLGIGEDHDIEVYTKLWVRYCHRVVNVSVSPTLLRLLLSYLSWADIVHLTAVYSFPTIPTLAACRILGKPLVWSPRGMLQRWEGTRRPQLKTVWEALCRIAAPKRLVIHATSEEEARESEQRLPGMKTVVIPNGVEIPKAMAGRNGRHGRIFAYLGRLHPKKGIENLLDAYARVQGALGVPSSLVIAGDGDQPYVQSLRNRIQQSGMSGKVRMIGQVHGDAKTEFLQNADVLIVPSYTENFGLVVAEALAHAVPVIVSRGTPWQRVEEIGCGLWVENDPESLAAAIQRISVMPLREMGLKGREWMQTEFDWDSVASKMLNVYRSLTPAK